MTWFETINKEEMEWYSKLGKVVEFDSESKAMYRRKKLNADLGPNEPQWEMTTIFGKPMLRRRWED